MKEVIYYIIETLICSGVLLASYSIMLERRTNHLWCRLFLLISTPCAAIIPLLSIPLWPAKQLSGEIETGEIVAQFLTTNPEQSIRWVAILLIIYALGVGLILGSMLLQFTRIRSLEKKATTLRTDTYTLKLTSERIAAFSFFTTIYICAETPEQDLEAIIAHESSHIAHNHSSERIAMEVTKAILWWNPFVWIAARKLTEVEEFEADSDVLNKGYNTYKYMSTIFQQLFGYSPDIANGLRNSLTKKRFEMMTKKLSARYSLLRLSATLPVLVALLCAFSLTTRASTNQSAQEQIADQSPSTPTTQPTDDQANTPFLVIEQMPKFQGGEINAFRNWVAQTINYPAEALKSEIEGRVVVKFIIERDGSLSTITVLQSPNKLLSDEAIRALKSSPKWTPGKQHGEVQRVLFTIPVDFRLPAKK